MQQPLGPSRENDDFAQILSRTRRNIDRVNQTFGGSLLPLSSSSSAGALSSNGFGLGMSYGNSGGLGYLGGGSYLDNSNRLVLRYSFYLFNFIVPR